MQTPTVTLSNKRAIEKAQIDWPSHKTQMFLGVVLIVLSCLFSYGGSLTIGFLQDDFLHLEYAARAISGDFMPLLKSLALNWGGSPDVAGFSPLTALSFFGDYVLYHIHPFGYHLSNIVAFCVCSVLVALVTLELTGRLGARSGALTALWAGLLFSVYPLHVSAVDWVSGRVVILATIFYLSSIFCFLRLQLLKEKEYLKRSLLFFALALASKETAVSLPLAIVLISALPERYVGIPKTAAEKAGEEAGVLTLVRKALLASWPFWLMLGAYVMLRLALAATISSVDGNSYDYWLRDFLNNFRPLFNKDSLTRIFLPLSASFYDNGKTLRLMAWGCGLPLVISTAAFLVRQLLLFARGEQKIALFFTPLLLVVWVILALVPALPLWHIDADLFGSNLFFLPSAGLCILIAMLALPSVETVSKKLFTLFTIPGLLASASLYLVWFCALQINGQAWHQASAILADFQSQLRQILLQTGDKKIAVINIPTYYKGAGILGQRSYLVVLNRQPFIGVDLSKHLLDSSFPNDYTFGLISEARIKRADMYAWSQDNKVLKQFKLADRDQSAVEATDLTRLFVKELDKLPVLQNEQWQTIARDKIYQRKLADGWTMIGGPAESNKDKENKDKENKVGGGLNGTIIWIPRAINPRLPQNWALTMLAAPGTDCKLVWRDCSSHEILGSASPVLDFASGRYVFDQGRQSSFLLCPDNLELGLVFKIAEKPCFKADSLRLEIISNY